MNTYPVDEQRISEVERGRICEAVVPLAPGVALVAGDPVLFALSRSRAGQQPSYVKGGDSVLVLLTAVTELESTDPATGQPLVLLRWVRPGPDEAAAPGPKRAPGGRRPAGPA